MSSEVLEKFGGYVRVRVCGIAVREDQVLVIRHKALFHEGPFWSPPGGSLEFGESIPEALIREFQEETQLGVEAGELLYVNEFIRSPLHTLELFFRVTVTSGDLLLGHDPEFREQIMEEAAWLPWAELKAMPADHVHAIFHKYQTLEDLLQPGGYGLQ